KTAKKTLICSSYLLYVPNRSLDYNASFTATHRTVSVYRVLQMRGVRVRRHTPCTSSARQQSRCGVL
ncbi:MAG: hypothetical protein J7K15_11385, partial [Deltaproteobacteria bacterium]|nr:hypothetical protein [Deltaproteobacteria bacterium]